MRPVFVCAFFILFGSGGYAQNNSLLWEVKGRGLSAPSYIFGTFHLMCKEDFWFGEKIKQYIKKTKIYYDEVDLSNPNLERDLMRYLIIEGKSIEEQMGVSDFKNADSVFTKLTGMSLKNLNQFKPFLAESMLSTFFFTCSDLIQPETKFSEYAKSLKLPVKGLETIQDQLRIIDEAEPIQEQIEGLKKLLLNFDSSRTLMQSMLKVYKKRNPDTLYQYIKNLGIDSKSEAALLIIRNKNWISIIDKAIATTPSFFAVGAGHLGGEQGILNLLRKEGYELKPIAY